MGHTLARVAGRKRWLVGGLTLVILAGVLVVGHGKENSGAKEAGDPGADAPPTARARALGPYALTVVPGVHLLGGLDPAAAYVVETADGLALIDAGLDPEADSLRQQMASLGLEWRRMRAVFLTHAHGDPCGGARYLRAATGAKVYAGRGDAAVLRAGGPREAFFSKFAMPEGTPLPPPTTVDVELDGDQVVTVGGVRFQALSAPGHTPGSVCYLMERDGRRILFSGDVILSLGAEQPLGTYAAYLPPRYRGDAGAFLASLRRLRALPAPDLVLPGHPCNDPVPVSPTMSQPRWEALLDRGIRELERLQTRYAADGANFLDGVPKKLLPDLYYLGDFRGVAVYGLFASGRFFLVNAPGGPGLGDFVNSRLRQLGRPAAAPAAVLLTAGSPEESAGVAELLAAGCPEVVALPAAWEKVKGSCPAGTRALAPADLSRKGWLPVTPLALGGRGVAPAAYLLPWGGKSVLFSGRVPVKPTWAASKGLRADLARAREDADAYRAALQRLGGLKPDLWLPALPVDGQNANLYDGEWADVLAGNAAALP
jgi:glyoxylase-like metal-dependent hydrolase (beta-lactamase superfamily II)